MTLEIDIENAACDRILRELGIINLKIKPAGKNGWPDRLFLLPAKRVIFIEFKRPGEVPEPLQAGIHRRIKHHGHEVQTHDTVQGAFDAVKAAKLEAACVPKTRNKVLTRK